MKSLVERIAEILTEDERKSFLEALINKVEKPKKEIGEEFNFEAVYKMYPRKVGKASGIKRLKLKVKSKYKYDFLLACTSNYIQHIKRERIEPKFIMHFSTFANCFEDWSPEETPLTPLVKPKDYSDLFR